MNTGLILYIRWASEKYDGVRACWNPKTKTMYIIIFVLLKSLNNFAPCVPRYGRSAVEVETSFLSRYSVVFPNSILLDGEIWYVDDWQW
jgi:hypothetical protein